MKKIALFLTTVAVLAMLVGGMVFASDVTDPKVAKPVVVSPNSDVTDPR
jgi:hypothetical protein